MKMIPMMICGVSMLASALLPASIRASGLLNAIAGEPPACDAPAVKIALLDQIYGSALTRARHTPGFAARQQLQVGQASLFQQLDGLRNAPLLLIETAVERGNGAPGHLSCMATLSYRIGGRPGPNPSAAQGAPPAHVRFTATTSRKLGETTVDLETGWQEPVALVESMALERYLRES